MAVKEYYNNKLVKLMGADGFTFGRRIFYSVDKLKVDEELRSHEMKHVEQYETNGILKFLFIYARDYVKGRLSGLSHKNAYFAIPFEIEAYGKRYEYK